MTSGKTHLSRRGVSHAIGILSLSAFASPAVWAGTTGQRLAQLPRDFNGLTALPATPNGRVFVADSLSYLSLRDDLAAGLRMTPSDVVAGSSFAGRQTFAVPISLGAKGVIAHAAGVGKDDAGIDGLRWADTFGVAAAACETMSARMSDGRSLYEDGVVGHVNDAAARLALVKTPSPNDVFVTGTHCGRTMAEYAIKVGPKGVIANDAGICRDRSGLVGLDLLETARIPGAAVAAMSARIGDGLSSYREGVISEANRPARERGVTAG